MSVDDSSPVPYPGLRLWFGHRAFWFWAIFLPFVYVLGFFRTSRPMVLGIIGVIVALALIASYAINHHDTNLCQECLDDTPLSDPAGAVEAKKRYLKAHHGRLWEALYSILLLAAFAAPWHWLIEVMLAASLAVYTLSLWFDHVHRPLQPWCPWCHWRDGGGDEEVAPDPAPSESKTT